MKNLNTTKSHSGWIADASDSTEKKVKKTWSVPMFYSLEGKKTLAGNTTGLYEGQVLGSGFYASVIS